MKLRVRSPRAAIAAWACAGIFACGDDDAPSGLDLQPVAENPAAFTEPRDAVPLDNGGTAFIARATGSAQRDLENAGQEGARAEIADRYAVFLIDPPGSAPRIIHDQLVAPFNLATNGKDLLFVADIGGGPDGAGALLQLTLAGQATPLAEGHKPQGVATDKGGKVYFTGTDPQTGAPGVFVLEGGAKPVVTGPPLRSPSGIDVADDGTIYVADPTAARDLDDGVISGNGTGALFKIAGGTATVVTAGFNGGYPTGIALLGNTVLISAYADRGANSAVLQVDLGAPRNPAVLGDRAGRLKDTWASAGLHRSRASNRLTWSGGNTVYSIAP
jgi:hypothetical protein